jgi:hypothetical protein
MLDGVKLSLFQALRAKMLIKAVKSLQKNHAKKKSSLQSSTTLFFLLCTLDLTPPALD